MPKFSARSNANLNTCHEDLQILFRVVVEEFDCSIICGQRNEEAQSAAFAAGLSKLRFPESKHNASPKSKATDAVPYPIDWHDRERFYFFAGYVLAIASEMYAAGKMKHRVRWGGDWDGDTDLKDQTFMDLPHFELIGVDDENTDS